MTTTAEESAAVATMLGFEVNRNFKFHVHSKDTEDFSIYKKNGMFKCWTGAFDGGDAIAFVMYIKDCGFNEAKEFVQEAIGQSDTLVFKETATKSGSLSADEKQPIPQSYLDAFTNSGDEYFNELKNLFTGEVDGKQLPVCDFESVKKIASKFEIKFVEKSKRLIMPVRNLYGEIITFWKYKKYGEVYINKDGKAIKHKKVLYSKERHRPPFAIAQMLEYRKNKDEYVLITEGEKDALVAYANGIRAICIGGAGASVSLKYEYLELFRDMKVIIAGDYDKAGFEFNENLQEQLKSVAKKVVVLDWVTKSKKEGFHLFDKFDLSDYFAWKYSKTVNTQVKVFKSILPTLYTYISYDNTNFNSTVEFPLSW